MLTVLGTCWPRTNLIQRMCFFKTVQPINHALFLEWNAHHRSTYAGLSKTHNSSWNDGTHILFPVSFIIRTHASTSRTFNIRPLNNVSVSSLHPAIYFWNRHQHDSSWTLWPVLPWSCCIMQRQVVSAPLWRLQGLLHSDKEADTFQTHPRYDRLFVTRCQL